MNRLESIATIRSKLKAGSVSLGSWMQIPHPTVAEILGHLGYDWVAVDMEHGAFSAHQLPDLFRALELGKTLPLVRLAHGHPKDCKQALDAGAGGVIVPMVQTAEQLITVRDACRWPPAGMRGVGFSRANLFGQHFVSYREEAQAPILVAMIEHFRSIIDLENILDVEGLDAVLIGPYDLSASMGLTAQFDHPDFCSIVKVILETAASKSVPVGIHVVDPDLNELNLRIKAGYQFLVYSIDAVMLRSVAAIKVDSPL
jgi:2-dehydro-3-deoxyglucarate aldolase